MAKAASSICWMISKGFLSVNKKALDYSRAFVPRAGIEPALPKEQDFESSASTSSATEAFFRLSGLQRYKQNNFLAN